MSNNTYVLIMVLVMAAVTALLRFLPFFVFSNRETPKFLVYLGRVLPFSVMAMLVVYCLKDVDKTNVLPTLASVAVVVLMHIWKRNTLLSIVLGTACYMVLIRIL